MAYELDFATLQTRLEKVQVDLEHLSIRDSSTDDSKTTDTIMTTPSRPSSPMDLATPVTEDTEMSDDSSDSALTYDSDTEMTRPTLGSIYSCAIPSFDDRSPEIRDARLVNALLSLDEDIPMDLDDSVQDLLKNNTNANPTALGFMAFIVDDDYLDRQEEIAEKKAATPSLPRSKAYQARKAAELKEKIDNWDTCPLSTDADW